MILSTYTKCASDKPPTSAVLVFLVEKDTLRGPKIEMKGLTLERDKEWKEVVRLFCTEQDSQKRKNEYIIRKNDFID